MKRKAEDNDGRHSASNTETADAIRQLSESGGQELSGHSASNIDMSSLDGRYNNEVLKEKTTRGGGLRNASQMAEGRLSRIKEIVVFIKSFSVALLVVPRATSTQRRATLL